MLVRTNNVKFQSVIGIGFTKTKLQQPLNTYNGVMWAITLPFVLISFGFVELPDVKLTRQERRIIDRKEKERFQKKSMQTAK